MRQRRLMNQINVVPYIDVMLVLLVIFMVTAPMIQQGTINVPSAGAGTPPPQAEAIFIEVKTGTSGGLALALRPSTSGNSLPIRNDQLETALKDAIAKNPEQTFLVAAESKLEYQKVIDVLETARSAGVRKISLVTQSATTAK
ncbi:ExbD/TolR family protein [Thauera aromatica]|uniref:Tol biopolymer transport system, TolR protein n=1 Tax=Thauera aromatica K172 TaxID=44139 RepID=A0A2R4BQZ3_THAAR|nr:ExbD/TolR family protein [Thauera aromatica]AVR89758.1 Tol biopolymer transport system, TolR protein [Thauera aromatica K172]MCK2095999.1 ExbD/TolR family protein [Thauera aromatica]